MMSITAPIIKKEKITYGTSAVSFEVGSDFSFKAGQYVTVTLPQLTDHPVKEQFHDFSITSAPEELPELTITYRDSASVYKKTLQAMQTGDKVLVDGPKGVFTLPVEDIPLVFLAGGVGITPFISMIRHLKQSPRATKPILFYYNRSRENAAYLEELEGCHEVIELRTVFGPLTQDSLTLGGVQVVQALWYVAGPPGMVKAAREILSMVGIGDDYLRTEEFTGYE